MTDVSNTILLDNITISTEREQGEVDQFIVDRVNRILNIGFQPDWTPEERAGVIEEYRRALRHHPQWVLSKAFDIAVRSSANRPTPGNIQCAAQSVTKYHRDQMARNNRLAEQEAQDRQSLKRSRPDREAAQEIVNRAGFTAKRMETLKNRPMINTFAQADEEAERPSKPHWSNGLSADHPQMHALRRARIKAGIIQEAAE